MAEDGRPSGRGRAVTRQVELRVVRDADGRRGSLQSTWEYDAGRPFEVTVNFGDREWTVGRDLVADGLAVPTGSGDLSFWPDRRGVLGMRLSGPDGWALFEMHTKAIREFLADTYKLCARGREVVDFDPVIAEILKESSR